MIAFAALWFAAIGGACIICYHVGRARGSEDAWNDMVDWSQAQRRSLAEVIDLHGRDRHRGGVA